MDPSHIAKKSKTHKADLIFITHSHDDHFCIDDILDLTKSETIIICPYDVNEILMKNYDDLNIVPLKPNESRKLLISV